VADTHETTHAYRTDNLAAIAAFHAARAAGIEHLHRINADRELLGGSTGFVGGPKGFGGPVHLVGLRPDDSGQIPAGWRLNRRDKILKPQKPAAVQWLDERQPGNSCDPAYVLKAYGMAYQSRVGTLGDFLIFYPTVFEHNGYLWAGYRGEPDGDFPGEPAGITWPRVPIYNFRAALDSFAAARDLEEARR